MTEKKEKCKVCDERDSIEWYDKIQTELNDFEKYQEESDNTIALNDLEQLFLIRERVMYLVEKVKQFILTE